MENNAKNHNLDQIVLKLEEDGFVGYYDSPGFFQKTIHIEKYSYELKINIFKRGAMNLTVKRISDKSNIISINYWNLPSNLIENFINSSIAIMMYFIGVVKENSEFCLDIDAEIGENRIVLGISSLDLDFHKFDTKARARSISNFNFFFVFDEEFDNNVIWGVENRPDPVSIHAVSMSDVLEGKTDKLILS